MLHYAALCCTCTVLVNWSCPCNLAARLSLQKLHREICRAGAQSDHQADAFVDASLNDSDQTSFTQKTHPAASHGALPLYREQGNQGNLAIRTQNDNSDAGGQVLVAARCYECQECQTKPRQMDTSTSPPNTPQH